MSPQEQAVIDAAIAWYRCWDSQSLPPSVEAGQDFGEVPLWQACEALNAVAKPPKKIDVTVRDSTGTFVARGGGKSVSCTMGASQAVKNLAVKLWGEGKHDCACMGHIENGVQRWQIARGK